MAAAQGPGSSVCAPAASGLACSRSLIYLPPCAWHVHYVFIAFWLSFAPSLCELLSSAFCTGRWPLSNSPKPRIGWATSLLFRVGASQAENPDPRSLHGLVFSPEVLNFFGFRTSLHCSKVLKVLKTFCLDGLFLLIVIVLDIKIDKLKIYIFIY